MDDLHVRGDQSNALRDSNYTEDSVAQVDIQSLPASIMLTTLGPDPGFLRRQPKKELGRSSDTVRRRRREFGHERDQESLSRLQVVRVVSVV